MAEDGGMWRQYVGEAKKNLLGFNGHRSKQLSKLHYLFLAKILKWLATDIQSIVFKACSMLKFVQHW